MTADDAAALPLRPGDEHAILFDAEAQRFARSVNYAVGDDILLHLIVRAPEGVLVVNDLLDGHWGAERQLPLDAARGAEGVRVRVVLAEDGFRIGLGEEAAVAFQPRRGMAGAVELRGAPGVTIAVRGGAGQREDGPAIPAGEAREPLRPAGAGAGERPGDSGPPASVPVGRLPDHARAQAAGSDGAVAGIARVPAASLEGIGLHAPVSDGRRAWRWLGRHAAIVLRARVAAREIRLYVVAVAPGLDREALFCTVNGIHARHRWLDDGDGQLALSVAIPEGGDLGGMVGVLRLSFAGQAEAPDGTGAVTIACCEVGLSAGGPALAG